MFRLAAILVTALLILPGQSSAQQAAPAQPAAPAPQASAPPPLPASAVPYNYNAGDRRDPFLALTGTGGDPKAPPKRTGDGIAAMRVDDVTVRGVMQSRDRFVAMVQGADNRTYLIHQGDKLADGVVKSVMPDGVVLVQDVDDPRSKQKTRDVRKLLRSAEDEKE